MKATSIEQIREHLARGGRVANLSYEARSTYDRYIIAKMTNGFEFQVEFRPGYWNLLPLEEKEPVDHGTQKGQEERFRDSQKERMQRIRTRLLHGQWPEMSDLMDWWEATTGERIEWGRRCERCDGRGRSKEVQRVGCFYGYVGCNDCQGSGYSVRPTWMEEKQ